VEGVFAKKFSGAGEDSAVGACVRLQSRACGRGLRSRRLHSSLISGLLGLEGISKRKAAPGEAADWLKFKDPDLCGRQAGGGGGFGASIPNM
jgi:hypothetical protein